MRPDQSRAEQPPDPRIAKLRQLVRGEGGLDRGIADIARDISEDVNIVVDTEKSLVGALGEMRRTWGVVLHESATGDDSDKKYGYVLGALDQLRTTAEKSALVAQALQRISERAKID